MAIGSIFGFWVNSWLFGRYFVDFWPLGRFLAFGTIFGFLDDFCHLGLFLAFRSIFGFWVNSLRFDPFFVDFWPLVRFSLFWTIFGFLDDFCHLG